MKPQTYYEELYQLLLSKGILDKEAKGMLAFLKEAAAEYEDEEAYLKQLGTPEQACVLFGVGNKAQDDRPEEFHTDEFMQEKDSMTGLSRNLPPLPDQENNQNTAEKESTQTQNVTSDWQTLIQDCRKAAGTLKKLILQSIPEEAFVFNDSQEPEPVRIFDLEGPVSQIKASLKNGKLEVKAGSSLRLTAEKGGADIEVIEQEGTLCIHQKLGWKNARLILELPEEQTLQSAGVRLCNGSLFWHEISAQKASLNSDNGTFRIENACFDDLQAANCNGKVSLKEITAGILDADSANGKVSLEDIRCHSGKAQCQNGSIQALLPADFFIQASSEIGRITAVGFEPIGMEEKTITGQKGKYGLAKAENSIVLHSACGKIRLQKIQ